MQMLSIWSFCVKPSLWKSMGFTRWGLTYLYIFESWTATLIGFYRQLVLDHAINSKLCKVISIFGWLVSVQYATYPITHPFFTSIIWSTCRGLPLQVCTRTQCRHLPLSGRGRACHSHLMRLVKLTGRLIGLIYWQASDKPTHPYLRTRWSIIGNFQWSRIPCRGVCKSLMLPHRTWNRPHCTLIAKI